MKFYTITVNGNTYEVSVEEGTGASHPVAAAPAAAPAAPKAASAAAPAPKAPEVKPVKAPAAGAAGNLKLNSPMPGKILALKASIGQTVKRGEVVLILEAMKMENEIVAPQDGTIASINVSAGQSVEAGELLITMN